MYLKPPAKYYNASWGENPIIWLKKSLYGQAEAPRLWYEKLNEVLGKRGFNPSNVEPCMIISKNLICVQYDDDCLWLYNNQKELEKVLHLFQDDGDKQNWEMSVDITVTE